MPKKKYQDLNTIDEAIIQMIEQGNKVERKTTHIIILNNKSMIEIREQNKTIKLYDSYNVFPKNLQNFVDKLKKAGYEVR